MSFLVYIANSHPMKEKLTPSLRFLAEEASIEYFKTISSLQERLAQYLDSNTRAAIFIEKSEMLYQLNDLAPVFDLIPILLVVPDTNPETLNAAYRLHPRLVIGPDNDQAFIDQLIRHFATSDRNVPSLDNLQ